MNNICNINNIPKEYMYDPDFKSKLKTILKENFIYENNDGGIQKEISFRKYN
jgi:hypothetical protein